MEIAALIVGILALILGSAGFGAGLWSVVQVLAWQRSTHRITQMPVQLEETTIEDDLPAHIRDQLPSPPEKLTATEYLKWQARQEAEDDFFSSDSDI